MRSPASILRPNQFEELTRERRRRFPACHNLALFWARLSLLPGEFAASGRLAAWCWATCCWAGSARGMGRVYRRARQLHRIVALKVFRKELLADLDAEGISRFYQEVQAVGRLSHPHVIHAYDARPVARTFWRWNFWKASIWAGWSSSRARCKSRRRATTFGRQLSVCSTPTSAPGASRPEAVELAGSAAEASRRSAAARATAWGLVRSLIWVSQAADVRRRPLQPRPHAARRCARHTDYMAPSRSDDPHQADIRATSTASAAPCITCSRARCRSQAAFPAENQSASGRNAAADRAASPDAGHAGPL